jgi:hypothetical protein
MASIEDIQRAYIKAQAQRKADVADGGRGDKTHHAVKPVEHTLGNRVPADRVKS